jgi:signal transduction histidine kinase
MDVLFDYDPAIGPGPEGRSRERTDQLLGCYQQALGHELPNLLVSLQGLARLLCEEQGARLDPEGRSLLDRLAGLARKADTLARSTARVGRIYRDYGPLSRVSLSDAAREALAEVNLLSTAPGVEYDVASDMPVLAISRLALHQVFVQLLGNAARAGVRGRPLRVRISARCVSDGVELQIADNGCGISDDVARRIGEPFCPGSGLGLGLFLVRQFVSGWGGSLQITSAPERGTTVSILFREPIPVRPDPEVEHRSP